jgi:hypothetical protein
MVQHYEDGGKVADTRSVTDESYIAKLINKMSPQQLQAMLGNPTVPRAQKIMASNRLETLMHMEASAQRGLLGAAENTPSIQDMYPAEETAYGANGGIVAFAGGDDDGSFVVDPMMGTTQSTTASDDDRTFLERIGLGNRENRRVLENLELQQRKKEQTTKSPPLPPAAKQTETPYDARTATRKSDYQKGLPDLNTSDLKGFTSALKGLPSSYKDEVLAAAKEFSKGDDEVNKKLDDLLGKDKKRSEDFKNDSSRMYWNNFFSGIAKAGAEPGQSGGRGIMTAISKSAGNMPEYEATLRKQQDQYDMLLEKNTVDNLKYKVALKDRNFDKALGLEKAIKENQFQMQQLQQQAAATAAHSKLAMAQLEQTGRYQQGMLDVYGKRADAMAGANKARMAAAEAKVMPLFQSDPNTRKLAKQLEDLHGKNWQSQPGPQQTYWNAYQTFKARTMPSLVEPSASSIPYSDDL